MKVNCKIQRYSSGEQTINIKFLLFVLNVYIYIYNKSDSKNNYNADDDIEVAGSMDQNSLKQEAMEAVGGGLYLYIYIQTNREKNVRNLTNSKINLWRKIL